MAQKQLVPEALRCRFVFTKRGTKRPVHVEQGERGDILPFAKQGVEERTALGAFVTESPADMPIST
jgi:hypothetical protein